MDNQVIYDVVKEVRDDCKEISDKFQLHTDKFQEHLLQDQKMADDLRHLADSILEYNKILGKLTDTVVKHEMRSTGMETFLFGNKETEQGGLYDDFKEVKKKVELLEAPEKAKEYLRKKYIKWGAIIGTTGTIVATITKFLGLW